MALSKLGKSFTELMEQNREKAPDQINEISIENIKKNPNQPRTRFNDQALEDLKESIEAHGLLQPLVVIKKLNHFELVAGERRLRAVTALGWKRVPVRVVDLDENHSLQAALVENVQREDLNPIECAIAYRELITRFGLTQQQLAKQLGKNRSTITNTLRLLELPEKVKTMLENKELTTGHARALLALESAAEIEMMAEKIVNEALNVRAVENLSKDPVEAAGKDEKVTTQNKDPNVQAAEEELCHALGTRVTIRAGQKKGRITIEYYSLDDFDRIRARMLTQTNE